MSQGELEGEFESDDGPYVCPGCFAVGEEDCESDCPDEQMRRALEARDDEPEELSDSDEELLEQGEHCGDIWEFVPQCQQVEPLQEAAAELALASKRVTRKLAVFAASLNAEERAVFERRFGTTPASPVPAARSCPPPDRLIQLRRVGRLHPAEAPLSMLQGILGSEQGARSCRWCRDLVLEADGFDHDFCEPDVPTERITRPEFGPAPRLANVRWQDEVYCAHCNRWHEVELVAPPLAAERNITTAETLLCPCGTSISVAYSWRRRAVVGLRFAPPERPNPRLGSEKLN